MFTLPKHFQSVKTTFAFMFKCNCKISANSAVYLAGTSYENSFLVGFRTHLFASEKSFHPIACAWEYYGSSCYS